MRIGTLARATGVSRRLLRYYEEQGLLRPTRRGNGYREYTEADATAVRHIRALLAAGLPTAVIVEILDCVHDDGELMVPSACPGMAAHLLRERDRITGAIDGLLSSRQALDTMLAVIMELPETRGEPSRDAAGPGGEPAVEKVSGG